MGMVIGDVSGKGAPAAIYAALVSGILRSHAPIEPGPAEMLRAVNFSLGERRIDGQFVSLIYAVWDDESRIPAGCQFRPAAPALLPRWQDRSHRSHRPASGVVRRCRIRRVHLQSQTRRHVRLLQRRHSGCQQQGRRHVRAHPGGEIVAGCAEISADCVVKSLFKAVAEHAGGEEAFDDETVVAIKVKGEPKRK